MFVSRAATCIFSNLKHLLPEAGLVREGLLPVITEGGMFGWGWNPDGCKESCIGLNVCPHWKLGCSNPGHIKPNKSLILDWIVQIICQMFIYSQKVGMS